MLKDFQVDLELSPRDNRVIQTGATYWSHDVNTAKIVVNLKRNSEPIILSSTVSVRMIMVFDDNDTQKKQVHKMTIDDTQNGVVSLILPKETLGFVGNVLCGVYVNYGENQSTDNGYFTFSMRRSLIDGEFPQLENGYVSEFQTMLDYMIETASEFDNVEEKLNKRIDVIEKDIASNEIAKQPEVTAIKKEVKDLKFGCTNLLHQENISTFYYLSPQPGVVSHDKFHSYIIEVEENEQYSFKRYDKDYSKDKGDRLRLIFFKDKPKPGDIGLEITEQIESDISKKIGFEVPDGYNYLLLLLAISTHEIPKSNTFFKLVEGNRISDWSPSPKDMADKKDIGSLQKQIDELKNAITTLGGTL